MKMLRNLLLSLVVVSVVVGPGVAFGAVFPLFTETITDPPWTERIETSNEPFFGNVVSTAPTPFGTGDALRMYDFATDEKPELRGEFTPLTSAFQIDFQSYNQSPQPPPAGHEKRAIRFRMANAGDSVTSESRSAFSLSWQANGDFNAKYSDGGANDGTVDDVDTKSINMPFTTVFGVTMIGNASTAANYLYEFNGETRTLFPQHFDVYVNGVLLNSGADAWFANGMKFTLEKSADDYNPALGLGQFGLLGSGDSDIGPDILYDDIIIKTGDDMDTVVIPEPATFGLLLGALIAVGVIRRRR